MQFSVGFDSSFSCPLFFSLSASSSFSENLICSVIKNRKIKVVVITLNMLAEVGDDIMQISRALGQCWTNINIKTLKYMVFLLGHHE